MTTKKITKPIVLATPQQLAAAYKQLTIAFLVKLLIILLKVVLVDQMPMEQVPLVLALLLMIASLAATIYLCVALYKAARTLGFSQATTILSVVLSFLLPLLLFILTISADWRLARALQAHGWKIGLVDAKPSK